MYPKTLITQKAEPEPVQAQTWLLLPDYIIILLKRRRIVRDIFFTEKGRTKWAESRRGRIRGSQTLSIHASRPWPQKLTETNMSLTLEGNRCSLSFVILTSKRCLDWFIQKYRHFLLWILKFLTFSQTNNLAKRGRGGGRGIAYMAAKINNVFQLCGYA